MSPAGIFTNSGTGGHFCLGGWPAEAAGAAPFASGEDGFPAGGTGFPKRFLKGFMAEPERMGDSGGGPGQCLSRFGKATASAMATPRYNPKAVMEISTLSTYLAGVGNAFLKTAVLTA